MYLLDTNICIYAIKKKYPPLLNKIKSHIGQGLYLSTLTIAEMEYGIARSQYPERNKVALLKFASIFDLLPFDDGDAVAYGQIRANLMQRGKPIGPMDMLLAAQALSKDLILVTNNTKEFKRVAGLQIEDWTRK